MRREEIRCAPEIAATHAEWRENILLHIRVPRVAGDLLDDAREIHETRIRVAVPRAWLEDELLIRHHRDELVPRRWLERLPWLIVAVGPRGILKARGVRQQHSNGDAVDHVVRVVDRAQLGNPAHDLVVERQLATIAKLHD